ncbi:TonB-dependent receptor [Phenylobacterium montanum]|uniref:TonB-dependent receptor n=1 Tax=Phenylobacterium montanum TaxID=2823693 RepID=A0A975G0X5_9CAUL|nr:TonB-dependent receptor [Caulobacter sp. S6]QUD88569.1 TonB-dependent receptor [Caulobacter sp. S6]
MNIRRRVLIGSASAAAIICAGAPAFAAAAATSPIDEIVVTGIRESLQRAIEVKKNSDNQVDAISATDIGKLPDKNVADALQRIPGVNISSAASGEGGFDENDRVSIRGTPASLTNVTIDGHAVATGDWFILDQFQTVGRSTSFDLVPSEVVQAVEVYKTQSAEQLEGGVAGAVDVITRKPLDFHKPFSAELSVQGAYNTISGETKPQVNGLINWKNDAGTFGVLLQGFYEERSVERHGQETLGYMTIDSTMLAGANHPDLIGVQAPTLIGSTLFRQEKERKGLDGHIQWAPTDKFSLDLSGFYSKLDASNRNYNYMYWGSRELTYNNGAGNLTGNSPTSYTVANNTLVAAAWPGVNSFGKSVEGLVVDNIIRPHAGSETYYVNLDGKYAVNDKLTLKGQIGYTEGLGETPQSPSFEADGAPGISYAASGNGWAVNPSIDPQNPAGLANDWAWNETFRSQDKEVYGKVDADWEVAHGPFKAVLAGVRAAEHTRQVDGWDRGCTLGANGQCWSSPTMPFSAVNPTTYGHGYSGGELGIPGLLIPIAGDPGAVENALNSITDGVHGPISSIRQAQNYYWMGSFKVQERDIAGYAMAKVGGEGWRGNVGVRIVDTEENAYVNSPSQLSAGAPLITTSAYGNYYLNHVQHDYLDILPSVNFTFDLRSNLLLRLSAAETMSRPDYSALGGTVSLNDLTLTGNGGNANLKPIKAAVYDAALEWYYQPTAVAAVSLFYDDLSSYVTFGNSTGVYIDQLLTGHNGPPVYRSYTITSPANTTGEVKGIELQVQQPLPMGFGVQANFTYVDAEDAKGTALVGTSRVTYNLVGYYENKWISTRLAYTYRSHYFVGLDRGAEENEDGVGTLDASVNVNVTPNVALTLDAKNITDPLLKYYAANKTQPRAVYDNGTQLFFGLRAKF